MPVSDRMFARDIAENRSFAMGLRDRVRRRMAARPVVVSNAITDVTREASGYATPVVVSRPLHWRFSAPPRFTADPRWPGFKRFKQDSAAVQSESAVDTWLDAALAGYNALSNREPSRLVNGELDIWKKLSVQAGTPMSWITVRLGPGTISEPPPEWRQTLTRVLEVYARAYQEGVVLPDPSDTNTGFPLFASHSPAGKVVGALPLASMPTAALSQELLDTLTLRCGLPASTTAAFGLASRTGPMYKPQPDLLYRGRPGSWHADVDVAGAWTRTRPVMMGAAGPQRRLAPLFERLHEARRHVPGLWHAGTLDEDHVRGVGPHQYRSDVSAMDDSTNRGLQLALAAAIAAQWPDLSEEVAFWMYLEDRPIITPSWDLDPTEAWVVPTGGGIHSGIKMTSEQGTLLAITSALYALASSGVDVSDWPNSSSVRILCQGDDIHIVATHAIDASAWSQAWAKLGYECELEDDDRFLARHRVAGLAFPVAGRIVQQTLSNEHEHVGRGSEGLSILGFASRSANSELLPQWLQALTWDVVKHAAWVEQAGASDLATLRQWCTTAPEALQKVEQALRDVAGMSWLARAVRDAEHSASSAAELEMAEMMGIDIDALISQDRIVSDIITAASTLTRAEAMDEAVRGYFAVLNDRRTRGGDWLSRLATRLGIHYHQRGADNAEPSEAA